MKKPPNIVAFTGPAGAGKSTAAAGLMFRGGFRRYRFADPLKEMCRTLLREVGCTIPTVERMIEGDLKERPIEILSGVTPRRLMQTLGTEWGRETVAPDFWADVWRMRAIGALEVGDRIVVDDCRFENEAAVIRALGGVVIGITRRDPARQAGAHASEAGVAPDLSVANDGTRAALDAALAALLGLPDRPTDDD